MALTEEQLVAVRVEIRRKARKRVFSRVSFGYHFIVFVMANLVMFELNQAYSPKTIWFVWPLTGWGCALLIHAYAAFQGGGMTDSMIEAEVQRELARRGLI